MLSKRIQKLRSQAEVRHTPTQQNLDIRRRHETLREVEGWYTATPEIGDALSDTVMRANYEYYKKSESRLKFTRWLARKGMATQKELSALGKQVGKPFPFKVSCRHNDLLRLPETTHYYTCFSGWRGAQQLRYLSDADLALVYVPDRRGEYKWRSLIRLVMLPDSEEYGWILYRSYGNASEMAVMRALDKILPLFITYNYPNPPRRIVTPTTNWFFHPTNLNRNDSDDIIALSGPTVVNNPIVTKIIWSDHKLSLDALGRTTMKGYRFIEK
ncbi:MAG: hypothetical protein KAS32_30370 [Candidatus Peribacteraceae bacterium]|nr:hypothetical protein [Candidatus Peribacteraceae bacterium]